MPTPQYNEAKLKEMILYIALVSEDDPHMGSTKLNKALFYADFLHYLETGNAISGAEYQRNKHGPTPRRLVPAQDALVKAGAAAYKKVAHQWDAEQNRFVVLQRPNLSIFSAEEIATIDRVLRILRPLTGTEAENRSHEFIGWDIAAEGETIPYAVVAVPNAPIPLTSGESEWAADVSRRAA